MSVRWKRWVLGLQKPFNFASTTNGVIKEGGERHADLKKVYKDVLEKFGKQHDFLSATHAKIDLKIKQVTGLRDGVSTEYSSGLLRRPQN